MELNNENKLDILCDFNELVYQYDCEFPLDNDIVGKLLKLKHKINFYSDEYEP
jgi:hypothetical protein